MQMEGKNRHRLGYERSVGNKLFHSTELSSKQTRWISILFGTWLFTNPFNPYSLPGAQLKNSD